MENEDKKMNPQGKESENHTLKPDPETLGKTDPQEKMEGPVSSLVQKSSKAMETKEDKEEANRRHDKEM